MGYIKHGGRMLETKNKIMDGKGRNGQGETKLPCGI